MTNSDIRALRQLRHRFIQDTLLPIQVFASPYFEQRLELFNNEFGASDKYADYCQQVEDFSGGNIEEYLEKYHDIREAIIKDITESDSFKAFCTDDAIAEKIRNHRPKIGNTNLYTLEQAGGKFLSFDLKKANFQALLHYDDNMFKGAKTYEDFIGMYTDIPWAKKSKRTRQIIFGQLNPKRTIKIENIYISDIEQWIWDNTNVSRHYDLFSMNSDEVIYKLKVGEDAEASEKDVRKDLSESVLLDNLGFDIRMRFFALNSYTFTSGEDKPLKYAYTKEYTNGKRDYKGIDMTYFIQIYKLINSMPINDDDLVFRFEGGELARFLGPLKEMKANEE